MTQLLRCVEEEMESEIANLRDSEAVRSSILKQLLRANDKEEEEAKEEEEVAS